MLSVIGLNKRLGSFMYWNSTRILCTGTICSLRFQRRVLKTSGPEFLLGDEFFDNFPYFLIRLVSNLSIVIFPPLKISSWVFISSYITLVFYLHSFFFLNICHFFPTICYVLRIKGLWKTKSSGS